MRRAGPPRRRSSGRGWVRVAAGRCAAHLEPDDGEAEGAEVGLRDHAEDVEGGGQDLQKADHRRGADEPACGQRDVPAQARRRARRRLSRAARPSARRRTEGCRAAARAVRRRRGSLVGHVRAAEHLFGLHERLLALGDQALVSLGYLGRHVGDRDPARGRRGAQAAQRAPSGAVCVPRGGRDGATGAASILSHPPIAGSCPRKAELAAAGAARAARRAPRRIL